MIKNTFTKQAAMAVVTTLLFGAVPAFSQTSADTEETYELTAIENKNSGILNANYTATDNTTGVIYGFDFTVKNRQVSGDNGNTVTEYYLDNVTFYGASAVNEETATIKVPEILTFTYNNKQIEGDVTKLSFEFNYGHDQSFDGIPDLEHIYLPKTISSVTCSGSDIEGFMKLHFTSLGVPSFKFSNSADSKIKIYVADEIFDDYKDTLDGLHYDYFLCRESTARTINIKVINPGSLSEEFYNYLENAKLARNIKIEGSLNDDDLKFFRRLPYIETLDLSEVKSVKTLRYLNDLKYLETVILPSLDLVELGEGVFKNDPSLINIRYSGNSLKRMMGAFEDCINLTSIEIPASVEIIGTNCFKGCLRLKNINFQAPSSLKEIGQEAFVQCPLTEISFPDGLETIGNAAFNKTSLTNVTLPSSVYKIDDNTFSDVKLERINLENVKEIGSNAFWYSNLKSIDLSNVERLGTSAFDHNISLSNVKFGEKLIEIPNYCFAGTSLISVKIPDSVKNIGEGAFQIATLEEVEFGLNTEYIGPGCFMNDSKLKKITLTPNIKTIGRFWDAGAFKGVYPDIVICKMLYPLDDNGFDSKDQMSHSTLYVPYLSLNSYLLHAAWLNFEDIQPLEDSEMTDVIFDKPFNLRTNQGLAEKANITNLSQLTIGRKAPLDLNSYTTTGQSYDGGWWDASSRYSGATLIVEEVKDVDETVIGTNMSADNLNFTLALGGDRWNFICLPFDVKVADIITDNDALWVVRRYDGELRSKVAESSWVNVSDGEILEAGKGYIIHSKSMNGNVFVNFTFKPIEDGRNNFFTCHDIKQPLEKHESEFLHNDSWNLVGNSYPAYVGIQAIEFDAPITVWEGNTYNAYLPIDDEFVLRPYQAFFVQRQNIGGGDMLTIKGKARAHTQEAALAWIDVEKEENAAMKAPAFNRERALFNIYLEGENGKDRTRVVVNENTSFNYKSNRDASKFMSSEILVPQIYLLNGDVAMAINERPLGNGEFILGTRFGSSGNYVISLDSRDADGYTSYLFDRKTGATVNISETSYAFTANEGTDDERFILTMTRGFNGEEDESGVENAVADNTKIIVNGNILNVTVSEAVEITVYSADGKVITSVNDNELTITLDKGVYIVKAGEKTCKVISNK